MSTDSTRLSVPVHEAVMQLFADCGLTISKREREVVLIADTHEEANAVFDWLMDIGDDTEGAPIGWKIIATGNDGSVLCESPYGNRRRYWFLGREKPAAQDDIRKRLGEA